LEAAEAAEAAAAAAVICKRLIHAAMRPLVGAQGLHLDCHDAFPLRGGGFCEIHLARSRVVQQTVRYSLEQHCESIDETCPTHWSLKYLTPAIRPNGTWALRQQVRRHASAALKGAVPA
jgi:hypothetical protein